MEVGNSLQGDEVNSITEKQDGTLVVTVRITLKPTRDDDLIALVRAAPPRGLAGVIREAMRNGIGQDSDVSSQEFDLDLGGLGIEL